MKKIALSLITVIVTTSLLLGARTAPAQTYDIKVSHEVSSKGSVHRTVWIPFKEAVEKRTAGKVTVTIYSGASLGRATSAYEQAETGIADITWGNIAYYPGRFPLLELLLLPLNIDNSPLALDLLKALRERFPEEIKREFPTVKVLTLRSEAGMPILMTTPVRTLEDIKGKRIRVGGLNAQVAEAVGAAPMVIPLPEAFLSLQKGLLDGVASPVAPANIFRLYEAARYTTDVHWGVGVLFTLMNQDKWNSLPPEYQNIIEGELIDKIAKYAAAKDKQDAMFKSRWTGTEFYKLSPDEQARWNERYQTVFDYYLKKMEEKGLPGKEWLNFTLEFLKKAKS